MLDVRPRDLGALVLVFDEDAHRFRVFEDVLRVASRARGIDRGADSADERQREVEQRPLEARSCEQAEGLTLLHAQGQQPVCELVDGPGGFRPGDLDPLAVHLVQVRRVGMRGRGRVPPQIRDRPGAGHFRESSRRNTRCGGEIDVPSARILPADAHNLERISQLRPRQHSRRPRARDEAGRPPVGHLVPAAAPRMPLADQAEALVPRARARRRVRRARQGLGGRQEPVRHGRGGRPRGDREARHVTLDRDQPVRASRRGRSGLLRSHLLPRPGGSRGTAPSLRAPAGGDEGCRRGRARPVRARRQGEALPDPADGRRARPRDPVHPRGREGPCGDRRGGRELRR